MLKKLICIIGLSAFHFLMPGGTYASGQTDSLENILKLHQEDDTIKINLLNDLSFLYYSISPEKAIERGNTAIALSIKLKFDRGLAKAYRVTGSGYMGQSEYEKALHYYSKALEAEETAGNKQGIGSNLMNIGLIYTYQSNYGKGLEYLLQALSMFEKIDFKKGISYCYGNIVLVYMETQQYEKALEYAKKAADLDRQTGNEGGMARNLGNIGTIYMEMNQPAKALVYMEEALKKFELLNDQRGIANTKGNMGGCFIKIGQYSKAYANLTEALLLYENLKSGKDIGNLLLNIGNLYFEYASKNRGASISSKGLSGMEEASVYAMRALQRSQSSGERITERDALMLLYKINKKQHKSEAALQFYEKYSEVRDSIFGQENRKELTRKELRFEFEKKLTADSIRNLSEKKMQKLELDAQKEKLAAEHTRQYALVAFILVLVGVSVFIYSRLHLTRKQKKIIEKQKDLVEFQRANIARQKKAIEEKSQEIYDSILYAKRLQQAILPSNKLLTKYLKDAFVFYKPKDIVAGDFYWMETFPKDEEGKYHIPSDFKGLPGDFILFAVADCTGHGVPGAMVSIFCSNALNRAVKEFYFMDPANILHKVRELVVETFEKSEMEVRDGMDISLCVLNYKTNELYWAGANNPLWLVRNNRMIEYKPDRQPIGKYENPGPFTTHYIQLEKGDKFYIFTDGLADQFGGEKGKKLKTGKLRELIMAQQSNSMQIQYDIMDKFFELWKGELEQVDDICVIGVSI